MAKRSRSPVHVPADGARGGPTPAKPWLSCGGLAGGLRTEQPKMCQGETAAPCVSPGGLRIVHPEICESVENALLQLVTVCEASDGALLSAARDLRKRSDRTCQLRSTAKQLRVDAEKMEDTALFCSSQRSPQLDALSTLEASNAARAAATEKLVEKKNVLQKARDEAEVATQDQKSAQLNEDQAISNAVACGGSQQKSDSWEEEKAELWQVAAERQVLRLAKKKTLVEKENALRRAAEDVELAEQGANSAQCALQQAISNVVLRCSRQQGGAPEREQAEKWREVADGLDLWVSECDTRTGDLLRILARRGGAAREAGGKEGLGLLALSESVLSYLSEQQERNRELVRAFTQVTTKGGLDRR